jgi:hypothetical protein
MSNDDKKEFVYEDHGLPDRKDYREALKICHEWLTQHMGKMFSQKQIGNFMKDQPITAAKHLMERTDQPSGASILAALLGPAKFDMIPHRDNPKGAENEAKARGIFGEDTLNLLKAMAKQPAALINSQVERDITRLFLVEGLSTMHDQLIGRKRIDPHHQVRWDILNDLEKKFETFKGQNPELDPLFEDALTQSRAALEALDEAAQPNNKPKDINTPKP